MKECCRIQMMARSYFLVGINYMGATAKSYLIWFIIFCSDFCFLKVLSQSLVFEHIESRLKLVKKSQKYSGYQFSHDVTLTYFSFDTNGMEWLI